VEPRFGFGNELPAIPMNDADAWRPGVNPWIIAIAVTLATFMEVLDTSIGQRCLAAHIAGSLSAGQDEKHLGPDLVPGIQRDRASPQRVAIFDRRPQALLHGLRLPVHGEFLPLRIRSNLPALIMLPHSSGCRRRGPAAQRTGDSCCTSHRQNVGWLSRFTGIAVVMAPAIGPTLGG